MFRTKTVAVLVAAAVLTLSGCSTASKDASETPTSNAPSSAESSATQDQDAFPVTIKHALGNTVIPAQPKRIATVAWANQEVPLALGVVPVGMAKATWGDDNGDGILPWVDDQLKALNAPAPVLFDESAGINFEAVANTNPDLILATYSGLSKEDYETLSKIAPVVAYPEVPWGTSFEDMIKMSSKAMGMSKQGEALVAELDTKVKSELDKHPKLKDARVLFSYLNPSDLSKISFYTSHDTRPAFLENLGLPTPEIVKTETAKTDQFYVELSAEKADLFKDVDIFVTYGKPDGKLIKQLQADPLYSKIPAIQEGRVAVLEENTPLAASANPSPLSIGWGVDKYFAALESALDTK